MPRLLVFGALCSIVLELVFATWRADGAELEDPSSVSSGTSPGTGAPVQPAAPWHVGSGIGDITGPPSDVMMQGYVDFAQTTAGIHTRLWARAFVIVDPATGERVALVSIDQIHVYEAVTRRVVELLRARFGDLYSERNLYIAATHTHSAPGGFSHYFLYTISTLGYSGMNLERVARGIFKAIERAHDTLEPGSIRMASGELTGASVNRSPDAYLLNPLDERNLYPDNVDRQMTVLRFDTADGRELGAMTWFAVHATSIKRKNRLIDGDNKGVASYLFERARKARYDGSRTFVAAFPNSNAGDVSPSAGADLDGDREWDCPLETDQACAEASGRKQYEKARALYDSATEAVVGGLEVRHTRVRFPGLVVEPRFGGGEARQTCTAGIGLSMLAGANDGVGIGRQGQRCSDGSTLARLLCLRNRCQGEKPVVLSTGRSRPRPWTPEVLPVQLVRIGQLVLVALPAELTTMAGRRLQATVLDELEPLGVTRAIPAGYANAYAGYVATREEYAQQDYEGASTHFGEWTLAAYQQEVRKLAVAMREGKAVEPGPVPRDMSRWHWPRTPGRHRRDRAPRGATFGAILEDVAPRYVPGEVVRARFWGADLNNDLEIGSFLEVQREVAGGWEAVAEDWDLETRLLWERARLGRSRVTVEWTIPADAAPGRYRIVHRGAWKGRGGIQRYEGVSGPFTVSGEGPAQADAAAGTNEATKEAARGSGSAAGAGAGGTGATGR